MVDLSKINKSNVGKLIDHAILPKTTAEADIRQGSREAVKYSCAAFYSSSPFWTPIILQELKGSDVLPATGIDFPFGASPSKLRALETEMAIEMGNRALDIVMNIGALKDKRYDIILQDLKQFKNIAGNDILTKVILEVCYLTDEQIVEGCKLIAEAGCDYAKTSTGQFEGPSMEQFLLMKETLKDTSVKLKVSGVKFPRPQNAYAFILAGADLIGTRAAVPIIEALDQMRAIGLVPPYTGD